MSFYSTLPMSSGYSSYSPRRSYRPTSFHLDDDSYSAFSLGELGYPPIPYTFPRRIDPELRYRRALYELQDAEQDFEAQIALERAHQVAILRQRAAEAARRDRALALHAEIEHARALQAQLDEYEQREAALRGLDRAPSRQRAILRSLVDGNFGRDSALNRCSFERRRNHCRPKPALARDDTDSSAVQEIFKLLAGIQTGPQAPTSVPISTPTAPSQQQPAADPQPPSSKPDDAQVSFKDIMEFLHGIVARPSDVGNEHKPTDTPAPVSQSEASPAEGKAKGKAKAEPVAEPGFFQTLLHESMQGGFAQELRDIERAIQLSLQERNFADVKKAHTSKALSSSSGASSSKVKIEGAPDVTSSAAAPPNHNATSVLANPTPSPALSPLTTVRSVRTQFYAIESAFKFPTTLDFDQSELAVTPNNAPVRAYEQTLNDFLKQLDAIGSDGDEEVRNVRREVVREVEKALENVERRIREQTPTPEVAKEEVKGYDVDREGPKDLITRDAPLSSVPPVTDDVKVSDPEPTMAVSVIDADVDLAISGEYISTAAAVSAPKAITAGLLDAGTTPVNEKATVFDADEAAAPSSDASGTITATTAVPALPSSDETFLASMSHDQFTFPPKPASSSGTTSAAAQQDDVVLVDGSDGGESVKDREDGWSEV